MKPKLKPDVYWVPRGDSLAFVHTGDLFTVKGRTALPLMDRLAPYLDGNVELDELVGGLPEAKREMVRTLVTALADAGLVKDVQHDEPHQLGPAELDRYAAEIAYIDHHLSSAARRFQDHRNARIVCIGAGLSLNALVHACLRSGSAEVTVLVTADCPTDTERLATYARAAQRDDPGQQVHQRSIVDTPEALLAAVELGDVVLHVSDRPVLRRARDLDRLCRLLGRPLIQGIVVADEAWTGPVAGTDRPGWESAWLRVLSNQPRAADGFTAEPVAESPFLAGPTAAIVANRVGFLCFRHLTGVAGLNSTPAPTEAISLVDLETLATSEHRVFDHPAAQPADPETESEFADRFAAFLAAPPRRPDDFSRRAAELFDRRLGLFQRLDEDELTQLPLHVAEVTVADPFNLLDTRSGHPVTVGIGDSFGAARQSAALHAFALYATLAVDARRLTAPADGTDESPRVFARNLVLDKSELIDAVLAYPVLGTPGAPAGDVRHPVGLAAATSSDEALRRALLDHCRELTVAGIAAAPAPFPEVPLADVDLDEVGGRYRDAVGTAQVPLRVYDVTGGLGVPVLAFCRPDSTICYAAGSDLAEAVTTGLAQVLLSYQADVNGHSGIAPPAVANLRPDLRGHPTAPAGARRPAEADGWRPLLAALHGAGYHVYAVPVGHDPIARAVLPSVVQVVVR